MMGAYVFTGVCLSNFLTGTPSSQLQGWVGVYPIQLTEGYPSFLTGGYSIPGLDRGYPHLRSGEGYPIPGMDGSYPYSRSGWGYPYPVDMGHPPHPGQVPGQDRGVPQGTPIQGWMGYPIQNPVRMLGTPGCPHPRLDWGMPYSELDGVPPGPGLDGVPSPSPRSGLDGGTSLWKIFLLKSLKVMMICNIVRC